ncbi:MAG TPA: hypothetical protein VF720_03365 [Candidatus Eisenbacteria bacterium]
MTFPGFDARPLALALAVGIAFVGLPLLGVVGPSDVRSAEYVYETADSLHPHIRYDDGSVSVNDRCAVRMTKLSRSMRPIYVNGKPIGFC